MKAILNIITVCLLLNLSCFAQFKGASVKLHKPKSKPFYLKSFSVQAPHSNQEFYIITGKIPGKAEIGFLVSDKTDKLSFYTLARYWNQNKKINKGDEYAMKLAAREYMEPKGYEGTLIEEKFIPQEDKSMLYLRKYAQAFNKKEQDTIEMAEVTYIQKNPKTTNEIIAFDLLMIGNNLSLDSCLSIAKSHIALIKPYSPAYNKKWNIETGVFMPFGFGQVQTDLSYVKVDNLKNLYFYKLSLTPGNLTGPSISLSRNVKGNFWATVGFGSYTSNEYGYDSLYRRGSYDAPPVLYDVKFSSSSLDYVRAGCEYRFYLNKRHSINALFNLKYSYGDKFIQLAGKQSLNGPTDTYKINYKNAAGFDFGLKYQFYFKNQRWGFNTGLKYLYTQYEMEKFTVNGEEKDISTAPYFFPKIKTMDISGLEFILGGFFQF